MKRRIGTLGLIVLLGMAGGVWASQYSEGFEAYVPGSNMHGQGGWKGWDNNPDAGAPVSNLYAHAGKNSVKIAGSSDLVHEFVLSGGKWVLTAWQYIPSQSTGTTYFILLNTYQDSGPYDWSAQTQYNLATGAITPWHGATGQGAKIKYDEWTEIRFIIDLEANTFEECITTM